MDLPDFSDCEFASPEPDADWHAVIANGGRARSFDRMMPAFKDALTPEEIDSVIAFLRGFCRDPRWPQGDLNLPRPLVTEKAFPENEALVTTGFEPANGKSASNAFVYERRIDARSQYEVAVPFNVQKTGAGTWSRGLGDVALAFKRVVLARMGAGLIASVGGEVKIPAGKETEGLGGGVTILEPFVTFGQILPSDGFLHLHSGFERSLNHDAASDVAFLRAAVGRTFTQPQDGRSWLPLVELVGEREITPGRHMQWDVVPQMQVTLSRRQHIMVNAGVQLPINERSGRNRRALVYLLWDWFDGGFLDGW